MKAPFASKTVADKTIKIGIDSPEPKEVPNISTPDTFGQLPVDVLENHSQICVMAPLAGVNIDDVEIVINEDVMTIKGKRESDDELLQISGAEYFAQECFWGDFSRSIILPSNVDTSQIEATEKNHILYIRIPKKPAIQMKIVRIKSK